MRITSTNNTHNNISCILDRLFCFYVEFSGDFIWNIWKNIKPYDIVLHEQDNVQALITYHNKRLGTPGTGAQFLNVSFPFDYVQSCMIYGNKKLIKIMLDHGCDLPLITFQGETPWTS